MWDFMQQAHWSNDELRVTILIYKLRGLDFKLSWYRIFDNKYSKNKNSIFFFFFFWIVLNFISKFT